MTFPRTWLAALVSSLLASAPVGAVTIGFAPGSTEAGLGEAVSVDVVVSDLGGEIVSAYDLDIVFDDGALRFDGATQTNALGDPSLFQAFLDATSGPGLVDLAGVSLLSDAALLGLQGGDTVTLATLVFTRVGAGTATVGFVFERGQRPEGQRCADPSARPGARPDHRSRRGDPRAERGADLWRGHDRGELGAATDLTRLLDSHRSLAPATPLRDHPPPACPQGEEERWPSRRPSGRTWR